MGEWHNSWFQELLLRGAEPRSEVKMKKNGLLFMPEKAGLVQDCSGQLRAALIRDTRSTHTSGHREWGTHNHEDEVKGGVPQGRLGLSGFTSCTPATELLATRPIPDPTH